MTKVASGTASSVSYTYDTKNRLTKATNNAKSITYHYEKNNTLIYSLVLPMKMLYVLLLGHMMIRGWLLAAKMLTRPINIPSRV